MATEGESKALALFNAAQDGSRLSDATRNVLEQPRVREQMMLASGIPASEMVGNDPLLLTILLDNSSSLNITVDSETGVGCNTTPDDIHSNTEAVRRGYNTIIDSLLTAPNKESIYVATHFLNGIDMDVVIPYRPLTEAIRLDALNFRPNGLTPLFRRTLEVGGAALLKVEEGIEEYKDGTRSAMVVVTDGFDTTTRQPEVGLPKVTPEQVKQLFEDMKRSRRHFVIGMGISDGHTDFRSIFASMGISTVLTTDCSTEDILKQFGRVAKAAYDTTKPEVFLQLVSGQRTMEDYK